MRRLKFDERNALAPLFKNPSSSIILAAFYTDIGEAWINDGLTCGIIYAGNTFYVGSETYQPIDKEMAEFLMDLISSKNSTCYIIPQNDKLLTFFDQYFDQEISNKNIIKSERHLMHINMKSLKHDLLMQFIDEIPAKYYLRPMDEDQFYYAKKNDNFLSYFVQLFHSVKDFEKDGFGFFLYDGSDVIAGISSYARYEHGVEVQISVKPEYRGQHLARSLGAKFILECEKRNLYPWWDCANPISEHIALTLGYELQRVTKVFKYMYD